MDANKLTKTAKKPNLNDIQQMLTSFEDDILPYLPSKDIILQRAKQRQLKKKLLRVSLLTMSGIFLGVYIYNPIHQQDYFMTQRGEQRNVYLNDGSQIKLNTDTHIYVQERLRSRKIILSKGEASFHVAHKRSKFLRYFERSFEVTSGNMLIIDIGTVFNVHKHSSDESSVTVLDGEIAVGLKDMKNPMIHLMKGQSLNSYKQYLSQPIQVNLDIIQAWQTGNIIFEQTSLNSALKNFQRYNDFNVKIENSELKNLKMNGQFKIKNYQHFMQVLPYVSAINVKKISEKEWEISKK